jgi:hypothetical protein
LVAAAARIDPTSCGDELGVTRWIPLALTLVAACADEPEIHFGPPGSIRDRRFESTTSEGGASTIFPKPFDPNDPPPAGEALASRHPYAKLGDTTESLGCHRANGTAAGKPWAFAGRVNPKRPGEPCEIIVTGVGHVKATPDGYFWSSGPPIRPEAKTAVRTAADVAVMSAAAAGACNGGGSCHGGATGPIVVPK